MAGYKWGISRVFIIVNRLEHLQTQPCEENSCGLCDVLCRFWQIFKPPNTRRGVFSRPLNNLK